MIKQIKDQKQLFTGYIDPDFGNLNVVEDKQVEKRKLNITDLKENKTFAQIFDKPEEQWVTQEEVIDFCENRKGELTDNWSSSFFLLKSNNEFFVARVFFAGAGRLGVRVYGRSKDFVWNASNQHRFVVPATKPVILNSDSQSLKPSDTLTIESAVNFLVEKGYRVTLEKFTK